MSSNSGFVYDSKIARLSLVNHSVRMCFLMRCPDCNYDNRPGVLLCENCNADLYDILLEQVSTKQINRAKTSDLRLDTSPSSRPLVVYIHQDEAPIIIERRDHQIIGRSDHDGQESVDIDLAAYGAQESGVSRQHLQVNAHLHPPVVIDLGSYNGTYVNGQKLTPDRPFPLESGDELRLARLVTHVYFK